MRKVVVTGMGILSPLGRGLDTNWTGVISGKSAITKLVRFDEMDLPVKIAGQIPRGTGFAMLNPEDVASPKELRHIDDFILYALAASDDAAKDSGIGTLNEQESLRSGVVIGSGIGGLNAITNTALTLNESGARRVSPFFIPSCVVNMAAGNVSLRYGLKGPSLALSTACATGSHAIGEAARMIICDEADIMFAGGTEAVLNPVAIAGFAQAKTLTASHNDSPETASRPWDKARDGFVLGEGAGILILEEYEHAKKRGAKIYAELTGYGLSSDSYHITAPCPDGEGAARAMIKALSKASLNPEEIGYINAHGTSTYLGDIAEVKAVKKIFGPMPKVSMSSTKSVTGHLLGAAGGIEAIFSILALQNNLLPPTVNLDDIDDSCLGIDLVPLQAKEKTLRNVMSNSFGFGGTNASLIFSSL